MSLAEASSTETYAFEFRVTERERAWRACTNNSYRTYACSDNLRIGLRWFGTYMSSNSVRYVRDRGSTTRVDLKTVFYACLTCNYLSVLHIPYHSTSPLPVYTSSQTSIPTIPYLVVFQVFHSENSPSPQKSKNIQLQEILEERRRGVDRTSNISPQTLLSKQVDSRIRPTTCTLYVSPVDVEIWIEQAAHHRD